MEHTNECDRNIPYTLPAPGELCSLPQQHSRQGVKTPVPRELAVRKRIRNHVVLRGSKGWYEDDLKAQHRKIDVGAPYVEGEGQTHSKYGLASGWRFLIR